MREERKVLRPSRRGFLRTGLACGAGLIASQFVRPKLLLASTTWNGQISASSDDAREVTGGTVNTNATSYIYRGASDDILGLRFQDVDVPGGATISNAVLTVYNSSVNGLHTDVGCNIQAELKLMSPTFTTATNDISSRTLTMHGVTWIADNNPNYPGWFASPDISAVIQEVVNQSGWASGNPLSIIWTPNSPGDPGLQITTYDGSTTLAAKLQITYS